MTSLNQSWCLTTIFWKTIYIRTFSWFSGKIHKNSFDNQVSHSKEFIESPLNNERYGKIASKIAFVGISQYQSSMKSNVSRVSGSLTNSSEQKLCFSLVKLWVPVTLYIQTFSCHNWFTSHMQRCVNNKQRWIILFTFAMRNKLNIK